MNNKIKIQDLSRSELLKYKFDLAIFALGYEPRCTHVASLLNSSSIKNSIVLSYKESAEDSSQKDNLEIFERLELSNMSSYTHDEVKGIYKIVHDKLSELPLSSHCTTILIDYSSMSRNWYSAILNYLFNIFKGDAEITLVYSCAEYPLDKGFLDFELGDVKVLPGCQGSSITKSKTASIFMLGFDKIGPLSFYNLLEPDLTYGVIAAPGSLPDYESQARQINSQFIQHQLNNGKNLVCAPIYSVSQTFENLCQLIRPIKENFNISIVQFGPKPHLLASTIAGLTFGNVSCIYSEYKRSMTHQVKPSGELVISTVSVKANK